MPQTAMTADEAFEKLSRYQKRWVAELYWKESNDDMQHGQPLPKGAWEDYMRKYTQNKKNFVAAYNYVVNVRNLDIPSDAKIIASVERSGKGHNSFWQL